MRHGLCFLNSNDIACFRVYLIRRIYRLFQGGVFIRVFPSPLVYRDCVHCWFPWLLVSRFPGCHGAGVYRWRIGPNPYLLAIGQHATKSIHDRQSMPAINMCSDKQAYLLRSFAGSRSIEGRCSLSARRLNIFETRFSCATPIPSPSVVALPGRCVSLNLTTNIPPYRRVVNSNRQLFIDLSIEAGKQRVCHRNRWWGGLC